MNMKKALIMIDYINDIVHPDGKISGCAKMIQESNIIEKCNQVLKYVRKEEWLVIWVKVAFDSAYTEVGKNSPIFTNAKNKSALIKDTWGTDFIEKLDYHPDELIIYKNRINPFFATNLELVLKANDTTELYIAGVSTNFAVEATVRDGHDRDFKINVIEDLCVSSEEGLHNYSISFMSKIATIIKSSDLINYANN